MDQVFYAAVGLILLFCITLGCADPAPRFEEGMGSDTSLVSDKTAAEWVRNSDRLKLAFAVIKGPFEQAADINRATESDTAVAVADGITDGVLEMDVALEDAPNHELTQLLNEFTVEAGLLADYIREGSGTGYILPTYESVISESYHDALAVLQEADSLLDSIGV